MPQVRVVAISMDHLVAEMAAFPLATEQSLGAAVTHLSPQLKVASGPPNGWDGNERTGELWRAAECQLTRRIPGVSIDELINVRDRLWFSRCRKSDDDYADQPVPLGKYIADIAKQFLRVRGATAVPCLTIEPGGAEFGQEQVPKARSREAWRWLTFAIPPDLLLAALRSEHGIPQSVDILSPPLREKLRSSGFAETHQHLGAGMDFSLLWTSTLRGLHSVNEQQLEKTFCSPGAEMHEGRQLGQWLLRAALFRNLLARFLTAARQAIHRDGNLATADFDSWLTKEVLRPSSKRDDDDARSRDDFENVRDREHLEDSREAEYSRTIAIVYDELRFGELTEELSILEIRDAYNWTSCKTGHCPDVHKTAAAIISRFHEHDCIAEWFPGSAGIDAQRPGTTPEMQFMAASLDYLERNGEFATTDRQDQAFASLLFQLVRVRGVYYRHVVQRPLTPGLQWFIRNYGRIGGGSETIGGQVTFASGAIASGLEQGLRSFEFRLGPWDDKGRGEMLAFLKQADTTLRQLRSQAGRSDSEQSQQHSPDETASTAAPDSEPEFEFGVVFHLVKDRGGEMLNGYPQGFQRRAHADPLSDAVKNSFGEMSGYRFGRYFQERRTEVELLANIILTHPLSLSIIRGVDVCCDETGIPTWVLRPLLNHVRKASEVASAWLVKNHHPFGLPPVRTTAHAGEDFVHLLSGLRRVEEAVRWFGLREGDRIGHAISLGVDPFAWAESVGRVPIAREERLWDLSWEWAMYARHNVPVSSQRRAHVEREIMRLSFAIFGRTVSPFEIEQLNEKLHRLTELQECGFPGDSLGSVSFAVQETKRERAGASPSVDEFAGKETLFRYLTDGDLYRRGQMSEWIVPAEESDALESLQHFLRDRISQIGITVEVNPTSNLLIANLGDLLSHPLWRLRPPGNLARFVRPSSSELKTMQNSTAWTTNGGFQELAAHVARSAPAATGRPLSICIGSDDPLTFATTLPGEYQLVFDSLVAGGLSSDEAYNWIHDVRRTGMESRFTVKRPKHMNSIDDIVTDLVYNLNFSLSTTSHGVK